MVGVVLKAVGCKPAPLLLGFILEPMLEENYRRALLISGSDLTTFVGSPISAVLLAISLIMLLMVLLPKVKAKRQDVFVE